MQVPLGRVCRDRYAQGLLASEQSAVVEHVSVVLSQFEQALCRAGDLPQAEAEQALKHRKELMTVLIKTADSPERSLSTACDWNSELS